MALEKCFENHPSPPLSQTFSFRSRPCRFEDCSQPASAILAERSAIDAESEESSSALLSPKKRECPYKAYCAASAAQLKKLENVYGPSIKVTLAEPSSSIVVRSEHQYNRKERRRLALRKHVYELRSSTEYPNVQQTWAPYVLNRAICHAMRESGVPLQVIELLQAKSALSFPTKAAFDAHLRSLSVPALLKSLDPSVHAETILRSCIPAATFDLRKAIVEMRTAGVPQLVIDNLARVMPDSFDNDEDAIQTVTSLLHDLEPQLSLTRIYRFASSALGCHAISEGDRFGRYLGFLDLRPNSITSPLAMGLLVPPRSYRRDPRTFTIAGEYGPLFGGPGFSSSVYSMQDPSQGGAACAQACAIMVLGMLSDRGARITGSFALTYLAKRANLEKLEIDPAPPHDCILFSFPGGASQCIGTFDVSGLKPDQLARLLRECNVSSSLIALKPGTDGLHLAYRLIEAYVTARYPVILAVDSREWWPWKSRQGEPGHAVTIIGLRETAGEPQFKSLIVHDPGYIPYFKRPFSECISAALAYGKDHVYLIAAAHAGLKRHAYDCVLALSNSPDGPVWRRFIADTRTPGRDCRIRLLRSEDVGHVLFTPGHFPTDDPQHRRMAKVLATRLPRSVYWSIACFENEQLCRAWFFDAHESETIVGCPWRGRVENKGSEMSLSGHTPGGGTFVENL